MQGHVLILAGSSRGIGKACLDLLLKHKVRIVSISRSDTPVNDAENHVHISGSVTDEAIQKAAVETARDRFGRLDGILYNAGILEPYARLEDTTAVEWRDAFEINFIGFVSLVRAACEDLQKSENARVTAVSSLSSKIPFGSLGAYSCSKAAMDRFVMELAHDFPDMNSVAVGPGMVATSMLATLKDRAGRLLPEKIAKQFEEAPVSTPELAAETLVKTHFYAPKEWNGKFVDIQEEKMQNLLSSTKLED